MMSSASTESMMFILYVKDQEESKLFYQELLKTEPILDVLGMTEFKLLTNVSLGIMPEVGIKKIIGKYMPDPNTGSGIPRCELYLFVDDPDESYQRLIRAGGQGVSKPKKRPWGDLVAYGADPDGHVIAFAKKL